MRLFFKKQNISVTTLLIFILFIVTILSMYSYNPHDASWAYGSTTHKVYKNLLGALGAQLAATIYFFLGDGFFIWLIAFLILFKWYLQQRRLFLIIERIIALNLFMINSLLIMQLPSGAVHSWHGGYIGDQLYTYLAFYTSPFIVSVIAFSIAASSLVVIMQHHGIWIVMKALHFIGASKEFLIKYQVFSRISYYMYLVTIVLLKPFTLWASIMRTWYDGSLFEDESDDTAEYLHSIELNKSKSVGDIIIKSANRFDYQNNNINHSLYQQDPGQDELSDIVFIEETVPLSAQKIKELSFMQSSESFLQKTAKNNSKFSLPTENFFGRNSLTIDQHQQEMVNQQASILEKKLERFGIQGKVVAIYNGPVVTLFEYEPHIDTKLSKIIALEDDLALALQALSIRILAPIPGKSVVGFEVARLSRCPVLFGDIISSTAFKNVQARLPIILGKDTIGQDVLIDLAAMPHLLVAGSTGSGKSVALNCMLISLLCKMNPQQLQLILIDPKRLEFAAYADIAHLLFPIVSDPRKAGPVLRWVVQEMERRYELMAAHGVRNIYDYQHSVHQEPLSYIVVVIDELADLMMTAGKETEELITRIAQMARASGIHLIVATQRPSVDVITGLIKVNFPSRISFRVTSKIDSRTILDTNGADKLLGRGDMLFLDAHAAGLRRVHGAYMSDVEINKVADHVRAQQPVHYKELQVQHTDALSAIDQEDEYLIAQIYSYLDSDNVEDISISLLQRKFRIGYNKSARIVSLLEERGKIMPMQSGKTRKVIK